ncbi:MAG: Holliday junction endonuclease [Candidatus Heimdallarchaeaceae archaeon]
MIVVGIDPGLKGAIGFIKNNKVKVLPMPTLKITKTKNALDERKLRKCLLKYKVGHVFIEKVHAMPGQGVTSMFNFGTGWGLIRGICVGLGLPYTLVTPQAWKKVICKGMPKGSKDVSIIIAKRLWPKVNLLPTKRSRKDSDGMADALCIAEYGKRTVAGDWDV